MIQAHIKKGQVFSTNKSVQNTIYLTMKDASKIELPVQVVMMAGTHSKSGTAADKAAKTERQYVVGYRPHRGDGARRR